MRIGELAFQIHVSRIHAWRLARAGIVPGAKRTKGKHFYIPETPQLQRWINFMCGWKFRKKELSRAYKKHYGSEKILCQKQEIGRASCRERV